MDKIFEYAGSSSSSSSGGVGGIMPSSAINFSSSTGLQGTIYSNTSIMPQNTMKSTSIMPQNIVHMSSIAVPQGPVIFNSILPQNKINSNTIPEPPPPASALRSIFDVLDKEMMEPNLLNKIPILRVHANWNQTIVRTGRLSCCRPNLQVCYFLFHFWLLCLLIYC
jgi:hypothetical protein